MTLHDLLADHESEIIAGMRMQRTTTPEEVVHSAALHDEHLSPQERAAFDTGSMRRITR